MFFLSKSPPGGYAISRPKHLELPVVSNLLIELFLIGMPVMRTDGQTGARSRDDKNFSDGWITKFSQVWGSARARFMLAWSPALVIIAYLKYIYSIGHYEESTPPSPEGCQQWQTFDNLWTLCRSTRGQSLRWLWSYSWISRTTFRNSLVTESLNALRNTLLTSATTSVGYFQRCISAITPNPRGFLWVAGVSLLLQCLFVRLFICLFVCTNL